MGNVLSTIPYVRGKRSAAYFLDEVYADLDRRLLDSIGYRIGLEAMNRDPRWTGSEAGSRFHDVRQRWRGTLNL